MSDHRHKESWLRHCSKRNVYNYTPSIVDNRSCYYHPSSINDGEEHHHCHKLINNYVKPTPTTNLRTRTCGQSGSKIYYRFHGGLSDGRGCTACKTTEYNTTARPLQLFEALDPIDMIKKSTKDDRFKNPVTKTWIPSIETSSGTGVFLPVYPRRMLFANVDDLKNEGMCVGGHGSGRMKQEDDFNKHFVDSDGVVEEENKDDDDIPIELLLPEEWTY